MEQKTAVVLAPHQDDEIAGAYLLMTRLQREGWRVCIVFATNGDYEGSAVAATRSRESVAVLEGMGIGTDSIFFLGYADTGMSYDDSFLLRLYHKKEIHRELFSPNSQHTYATGEHHTYRYEKTGGEASYTRSHFTEDLGGILQQLRPDLLILPSIHDHHGDHRAVGLFWKEIRERTGLRPDMRAYLLHGGDDPVWPSRDSPVFDSPPGVPSSVWARRTILDGGTALQARKKAALETFLSQKPQAYNRYLLSFAKQEEVFLEE